MFVQRVFLFGKAFYKKRRLKNLPQARENVGQLDAARVAKFCLVCYTLFHKRDFNFFLPSFEVFYA